MEKTIKSEEDKENEMIHAAASLLFTWMIHSLQGLTACNLLPHGRIGIDVLHAVIVHDTQVSFTQGGRQGSRNFSLGFDDLGLHFLRIGTHFLFLGHSHSPPFFRFCLGNVLIGFGLVCHELGTNIASHINIGNINGKDFKS